MHYPICFVLLAACTLCSGVPDACAANTNLSYCQLYNQINLLAGSVFAASETVMLTFAQRVLLLTEQMYARLQTLRQSLGKLAEYIEGRIHQLIERRRRSNEHWYGSWMDEWLDEPMYGLANTTRLATGAALQAIDGLDDRFAQSMSGADVLGELQTTMSFYIGRVEKEMRWFGGRRAARCNFTYDQAISLNRTIDMQAFAARCTENFAAEALEDVDSVTQSISGVREDIDDVLHGLDNFRFGEFFDVFKFVWRSLGKTLGDLGAGCASLAKRVLSLTGSYASCTDGIVQRMQSFVDHSQRQIESCWT